MNQKKAKKLRKQLKEVNGFDIHAKGDYRVSHSVKKVAYFNTSNQLGLKEVKAVPVERQTTVNAAKLPYRRLKKELQSRTKGKK